MRGWRGGERQAVLLAEGQARRGMDVLFVCRSQSALERVLKERGIPHLAMRIPFEADFYAILRIANILRKDGYDIVHSHDSHSHWIGGSAGLLARKVVKITSRRVDFSIYRHGFGLSYFKYRYFTDHIIAVSNAVKAVLLRCGLPASMVSVVHSGLPDAAPEKKDVRDVVGIEKDSLVVGTVGALVPHKGHKFLIDAAALVLKEQKDIHFVIIGEGRLKKELVERAKTIGVQDHLHFTGFREDAENLVGSFDLFVMSSVEEGLGTAVLDAYRHSVAVVVTDAGGLVEVVEDGVSGLVVRRGSGKALAEGILRVLSDGGLRKKLAEGGKRVLKSRFTDDIMVERTLDVYERLLR